MPGKKKREIEFQYYEIPHGERLLLLSAKIPPLEPKNELSCGKQQFHNLLEVGYCAAGKGEVWFREEKVEYGQGMITVIPQNFSHAITSRDNVGSDWEYLFFNPEDLLREFYPDNPMFAKRLLDTINRREQYYAAGGSKQLAALLRMITEECKNKGSYFSEYIRGLLLSMLLALARGTMETVEQLEVYGHPGGIGQISAAIEYIGKSYMENIKMKQLADTCNLSETHFRRLFAEYMNMTPLEYINQVRIRQACDLMKKTRYSMEEVASRVGYPAISTFNRNFRKIVGTSPYRYKNSN